MDINTLNWMSVDMTSEDYHAHPAWSRSQLVDLKTSERLFQVKHILKKLKKEPSPQMVIGEVVHLKILEPELYKSRVAVHPKFNRATKIGKAAYIEFLGNFAAYPIWISEEDEAIAEIMANNLRERIKRDLGEFISKSCVEHSFFWAEDGLNFKCRPDAFMEGLAMDVKTTKDLSYRSFQMDCVKRGYFLQAAMIRRGLRTQGINLERFVFACVENCEPFSTAIYILDSEAMAYGDLLFDSLKIKLGQCLESGVYEDQMIKIMTVPQWALQEDL